MLKHEKNSNEIEGLETYSIDCFADDRGSIFTTRPIGKQGREFVTDKFSISRNGTLRGLHGDRETAKLIFCVYGKMQLAVVDARRESQTYKNVQTFVLETNEDAKEVQAVWVPEGCLNGHLVLSDTAVFYYQWTQPYNLGMQIAVRYDDPDLKIPWLAVPTFLSERDKNSKFLSEVTL